MRRQPPDPLNNHCYLSTLSGQKTAETPQDYATGCRASNGKRPGSRRSLSYEEQSQRLLRLTPWPPLYYSQGGCEKGSADIPAKCWRSTPATHAHTLPCKSVMPRQGAAEIPTFPTSASHTTPDTALPTNF